MTTKYNLRKRKTMILVTITLIMVNIGIYFIVGIGAKKQIQSQLSRQEYTNELNQAIHLRNDYLRHQTD